MIRIQLEVPDTKNEELKTMKKRCGVRTNKDLFNNALTLLAWALKEVDSGRVIASVNEAEGKYKELVMPVFKASTDGKQRVPIQDLEPDK